MTDSRRVANAGFFSKLTLQLHKNMFAEVWHVFRKTVRSDSKEHRKPPIISSTNCISCDLLISLDNAQENPIALNSIEGHLPCPSATIRLTIRHTMEIGYFFLLIWLRRSSARAGSIAERSSYSFRAAFMSPRMMYTLPRA